MPQKAKYTLPDISDRNDIGANISKQRKKKGLSQKELASQTGITQALLSHYETGRLKIPVDVIIQICISLNIKSDILLGISKSTAPKNKEINRKILQRLEQIERLPSYDQKSLLKTIDNALKGANLPSED